MRFSKYLALTLIAVSTAALAQAQRTYPDRPIRIIVPYAAGGVSDTSARIVAQKLSENLHQAVIIDNKPGANTLVGAGEFARSAPDGYTLMFTDSSTITMNPSLYEKLPYDPVKQFDPIIKVAVIPNIVVANVNGPKTMKELVDYARENPGKVNYGYGATITQWGAQSLKDTFHLKMQEVPYKGGPAVAQGLLTGDVTFTVDAVTANLPFIASGRLVALANMGNTKIPALPNLPRVADVPGGEGFNATSWQGAFAPKGTPPAILNFLNAEITKILSADDVKDKLGNLGIVVENTKSPAEFREFLEADAKKWKSVIDKSGVAKLQ